MITTTMMNVALTVGTEALIGSKIIGIVAIEPGTMMIIPGVFNLDHDLAQDGLTKTVMIGTEITATTLTIAAANVAQDHHHGIKTRRVRPGPNGHGWHPVLSQPREM